MWRLDRVSFLVSVFRAWDIALRCHGFVCVFITRLASFLFSYGRCVLVARLSGRRERAQWRMGQLLVAELRMLQRHLVSPQRR